MKWTLGWCLLLVGTRAWAQEQAAPPRWAFDAQAYHYFLPDEPDFLLPIFMADRGALHLEARYNYEDIDTFSAFVGRSWELGALTLTPMLGGAVGQTDGVAPALELDLVSGPFEFWVEAEYLFDLNNRDDDFFYAWSEASLRVQRWLDLGLMAQRTKVFRQDVEVDWGLLGRLRRGPFAFLTYLVDPVGDAFFVVGLEAEF